MYKIQLKELIRDTLVEIGCYSESAVNLLMGTAAQETHLGFYIKQLNGPAKGIFQCEPATFGDYVKNYLTYNPNLKLRIENACDIRNWNPEALVYNLKFAICMARVHYLRISEPLPIKDAYHDMATYWKKYYNTYMGAGTTKEFIKNYKKYVL